MERAMRVTLLWIGMALVTAGCETAEQAVDCQKICQANRDCVDTSFDVETCRADCEEQLDTNESFRNEAKVCEACLERTECSEQADCFLECPIVR
ncbi:hypothetical protein [Chondromyces crocatus]|uniref:Uncharacterized protein n=1 Tax=Chondromyces crocatus TaxID=52 RepID=A0A0K1EH15_CHOCO|nr:hypothetical protein [Chondromyces crocatus]AKT40150.1 uncharacterized protein CMC5_043030 [Chondromyces crocatus]